MSRSASPASNPCLPGARTSFLPPSHKLLQLAAGRPAARPVHATDLRTTKFYKTKLCPFMQSKRGGGRCAEGFDCGYAHAVEELRNAPNLKRTKWCSKAVTGVQCSDPKCGYAHCAEELQPSADRQTLKTSLCVFWARDPKLCLNGDKCRFAHGLQDLRQRPALTPRCPSPLIDPTLACTQRTCSSVIPTKDGLTENVAATCSTDISNALTMVPTTEGGFDASSESTPLLPWDEIVFAQCHSRMRTALQSRFLSEVRASILQNEESLRPLLEGEISEPGKSVCISQPSISSRRQRSLEAHCKQVERDPGDSFFAWLPSGSLEHVGGSDNATTQMVEEGSLSGVTTAGPEGGEISYPAFPLFPPQVSPFKEARESSDNNRYQHARATTCTLLPNLANLSDSPQLPSADGHALKGTYSKPYSKRLDEEIVPPLISNGTPHSGRDYYRSAFIPLLHGLRASTKEANVLVRSRVLHIHKPCTDPCDSDTRDWQPPGCPRFLQEGRPHKRNSLLDFPSSFYLHKEVNADVQPARSIPRNNSQYRRDSSPLKGRSATHRNKVRPVLSATAVAVEKAVNSCRAWMENSAAATCVLSAQCAGNRRQQTVHRTPQAGEGYAAKSASPVARTTMTLHHNRDSCCIEQSTLLRRARQLVRELETSHAPALETATNSSAAHHSLCRQVPLELHHMNKEPTLAGSMTGVLVAYARPKSSTGTLNAHAPPFYPKTFVPFTSYHEGSEAEAEIQKILPAVLGVPAGRHSSGVPRADIHMSKGAEKRAHEEDCRRSQQHPSVQSFRVAHCGGRPLQLDAGFQLGCTSANTAVQPIVSVCSGSEDEREGKQIPLPMRPLTASPSSGGDTSSGGLAGMEGHKFFCNLSRASSVRRLPADAQVPAETSETSARFLAAAYSRQHSAVGPSETCQNRLTRQNSDHDSGQHLLSCPRNLVDCTRSRWGEELCMAASIPNLLRVRQARGRGSMLF